MEIWKTVVIDGVAYENYEVSNKGKIRSLSYKGTGKIKELTGAKDKDGYLMVCLCKGEKQKVCSIHRIVAFTFIENDDETKTQVNHIDEDKTNNSVENLEWCNAKYNINYGTRTERMAKSKSKKIIGKSLTENKVIIFNKLTQAQNFGFDASTISKCCKGKQRQHKGYVWSYID